MSKDLVEGERLIERELFNVERHIYDLEKIYLEEAVNFGNLIKGWDSNTGYKNQKHALFTTFKKPKIQEKERLFSLSSLSSQVHKRQRIELEDSEVEMEPGVSGGSNLRKIKKMKKMKAIRNMIKVKGNESEEFLSNSDSEKTLKVESIKKTVKPEKEENLKMVKNKKTLSTFRKKKIKVK